MLSQCAYQRLSKMPGAAGYQNFHVPYFFGNATKLEKNPAPGGTIVPQHSPEITAAMFWLN
jgi:hypothetical protein